MDNTDKARYDHSCSQCKYLGQYNEYDLYYCPQGGVPTVLARYGSQPQEYTSGMGSDHPALVEARSRWQDA